MPSAGKLVCGNESDQLVVPVAVWSAAASLDWSKALPLLQYLPVETCWIVTWTCDTPLPGITRAAADRARAARAPARVIVTPRSGRERGRRGRRLRVDLDLDAV